MSVLSSYSPTTSAGFHQPLGATITSVGINFALFAPEATQVQLLIWDHAHKRWPSRTYSLSPTRHKTGPIWHIMITGLPPNLRYAYQVAGPDTVGNRFDHHKALLDPYAHALDTSFYSREIACYSGDNRGDCLRGVVLAPSKFDWKQDSLPQIPLSQTIIYELHVRGFTRHPSSGVSHAGTFAGVTAKLPYLRDLGVTSIELMPIQAFDDDVPFTNSQGEDLINYWGYSQLSFSSIHGEYFRHQDSTRLQELKELVRTAHSLGLEVILDVVFNHTTEANQDGPNLSWRGLANSNYYLLSPADRRYYMNYTGCDNTFAANHPMSSHLIIASLEYLAREFHLDGFRFDLGATFYYDQQGFIDLPPIIDQINNSPILRPLKLIAEPWDASGLVLEGRFGGAHWLEWSGAWRDLVRGFVNLNHDPASSQDYLTYGAPAFRSQGKDPRLAVNFVTAHDGFTLRDLVSYAHKHNEENGYHGQDGSDQNLSANYGVEGENDDPALLQLRQDQAFRMLELTARAPGVMMLLMGDELWRTQGGNNNAFTQDNSISWLNWDLREQFPFWFERVQKLLWARRHGQL
jgi:glycogen operon protein